MIGVVCDKTLRDIKVEENDLIKIQTAGNNLTIKKNKGRQLNKSLLKLNLIN